jgi:tetratricopeptide (TPR) repeat protein
MRKNLLALCLTLISLTATANAQFFTSETSSKVGQKMAQRDHAGAIAILDQAIAARKDLSEAYQMRAILLAMTGNIDGAIADLTSALAINPNSASLYEQRANYRLFKRDNSGALQDLDAAIANGLKTEKVFIGRAAVKRNLGDTKGAVADYQAALAINPNLASAHNGLAFIYEIDGDRDAALKVLQEFLDRYESSRAGNLPTIKAQSKGASVTIKREGKETNGAQAFMVGEEFESFTANTPEEAEKKGAQLEQLLNLTQAYANLGRLHAKNGAFDKALEAYAKGLQIRKNDPYILKLRSEIRLRKGDLPGAVEDLTIVTKSRAGAPDLHFDKGLLLTLQGKDEEAEKEFALHRQMFPQSNPLANELVLAAKRLRLQQTQP